MPDRLLINMYRNLFKDPSKSVPVESLKNIEKMPDTGIQLDIFQNIVFFMYVSVPVRSKQKKTDKKKIVFFSCESNS
jgi:hypothetical protein